MNRSKQIWYLIKFFKEKVHADHFIDGYLYMNRLSFFKKIENVSDEGRRDDNEAVSHWLQPDNIIVKISVPAIGEIEITGKDLAAPISMQSAYHDNLHIFCMYAMWTDGFELIDGKINYAKEDSQRLKDQVQVDERCLSFGEYAVIVPAVQFIEKVKIALEREKKTSRMRLVDYFDGEKFNGEIDVREIPFKKLDKFSYQKEFRICIDNPTKGDDPHTLCLGNITEISALVKSSEINKLFNIDAILKD